MKPWLTALCLASVALAGGAEGPTLPRLELDARAVGRTADVRVVPGVPLREEPAFFFPTHVRAVLDRPGERWQPQYETDLPLAYVAVYPVAGLLAQYPQRGEPWNVRTQIERLNALNRGGLNEVKGPLPYLPLLNATLAAAGAVRQIETPSVRGVRYLSVASQEDGVRFPREAVFSTFQGLSRDGRFYVTVQMPYAPASLPTRAELLRTKTFEVAPYPAESGGRGPAHDAYRERVNAYRADLVTKLNAEDSSPGLRAFDALVRSIRLH